MGVCAGLPAQTKHGYLRMARGIRDPAMDAVVVILFDPYGVQSCSYLRRLCARHLAARSAKKTLDLPFVLGVMGWGIIHGQLDPRTDTTKFTTRKLAALVAHKLPGYAIREHSSLEYFNHFSDRLSLRQSAGDDCAGMVV